MTNEAAERLREWIVTAENAMGETMGEEVLDDALAAERKATVERIRAAATYDSRLTAASVDVVLAILDAEAAR